MHPARRTAALPLAVALSLPLGCSREPTSSGTKTAASAAASPSSQAASAPASQPASRPVVSLPKPWVDVPLGENRSGIRYADPDESCTGQKSCVCQAPELFHGRNALSRIGVGLEALTSGTPCLLADFDGNGHSDAVFLGAAQGEARPAVVLLFDSVGLSAVADLPKPISDVGLESGAPGRALIGTPSGLLFVYADGGFKLGMRPATSTSE